MGVFSGKRIIEVDSVVYNLAGDELKRPDYTKSLLVQNVLSGTKSSIAETFQAGYLNGPAMQLRSFYRWARNPDRFGLVGMPTGSLATKRSVSTLAVSNAIAEIYGHSAWIQKAEVRPADYDMWVEQYILNNAPHLIDTAWKADINASGTIITITWAGGGTSVFSPANFDFRAQYVFAYYNQVSGDQLGSITFDDETELGSAPFPSTAEWTYEGKITAGTWSETTWTKRTYVDAVSGGAKYLQEFMYLREDTDIPMRWVQMASRTTVGLEHSQARVFIYKIGSGNVGLDAASQPGPSMGQFFPTMPVRVNRTFLGPLTFGATFQQIKKGYKKATGGKLDKLIDKITDNDKINDIDAAYITFGVSLNVKENACKRYLYTFFRKLADTQIGGPGAYQAWKNIATAEADVFNAWYAWKQAQSDNEQDLHGTEEPPRPTVMSVDMNQVRVSSLASELPGVYACDTRINWIYIEEKTVNGQGKSGVKTGDCWFEEQVPDAILSNYYNGFENWGYTSSVPKVRLYWQVSANIYKYLDIVGLEYTNYPYGMKAVQIQANAALRDTDESGFIVPLHYDTWRETSLVQSSQMATACCFLIFNTYKITKTKWYQNGFFQILIVVAIAVLSVLFTGGAGMGLLGTHLAVGQAMGLTGMAAAIVGSVANSLAALVLTTLVSQLSSALFGPQFGAIVSSLFMLFLGSMASSFHMTGSLAIDWGSMLKVENLMKLTSAVGSAFTAGVQQEIAGIGESLENLAISSKGEAEKIQQAFFAEFGYGGGRIDPMMFVDVASSSRVLSEAPDTFLTRTLMTGSDIAELSKELITNYAEYSNKLPDAFV